jgi:AraC family transcriptional regulator
MILREFPDLAWLKEKVAERFCSRVGINGMRLSDDGFPSVIIHAKSRETWRPDITGPISIFTNIKGRSRAGVDGHLQTIPEGFFYLTNRSQPYSLSIGDEGPAETFNIHVGEAFSEGVLSALLTPADIILDDGFDQKETTINFFNRLYRRDPDFDKLLSRLQACENEKGFQKENFEEAIEDLLRYLLLRHRDGLKQLHQIPALKSSTRVAVYQRLSAALDYLHTTHDADTNVLARIACLSRFHFLRLFRQAFGSSPYQYGIRLRLEEAERLLRKERMPMIEIASTLGFENPQSFSRLFAQRYGCTPSAFRAQK